MESVGMRSLAVAFPANVRYNDFWTKNYPEVVAGLGQKTQPRLWAAPADKSSVSSIFDEEMGPYLDDPFRGTVARRVLAKGEKAMSMESRAARSALAAAKMSSSDVDLMMVSSFLPDQIGVGNASFLARELGLTGAAWNYESACSSSVVGFQTACALVQAGQYRNVLVVVSCSYTSTLDDKDTLSLFMGDGSGAFVVGAVPANQGLLGSKTINTSETCGAFYYEAQLDAEGHSRMHMGMDKAVNKVLRDTAADYVIRTCQGAATSAGVSLSDIDFFIFNTPNAWYAPFCARALGIAQDRTINAYPLYSNIGPALTTANLHLAAHTRRIKPGNLVMMYSVGSASTASASVIRWNDVALGPEPAEGLYANYLTPGRGAQ